MKAAEADINLNDRRPVADVRVHLPTNDITLMHSAVPFLPLPIAILCAVINVVVPGLGMLSTFQILFVSPVIIFKFN